jgi:hypothetical protein
MNRAELTGARQERSTIRDLYFLTYHSKVRMFDANPSQFFH